MEHGFNPPEDPNKPEGTENSDKSEPAAKTDAVKTD
jgi:hypothetical protein